MQEQIQVQIWKERKIMQIKVCWSPHHQRSHSMHALSPHNWYINQLLVCMSELEYQVLSSNDIIFFWDKYWGVISHPIWVKISYICWIYIKKWYLSWYEWRYYIFLGQILRIDISANMSEMSYICWIILIWVKILYLPGTNIEKWYLCQYEWRYHIFVGLYWYE